MVNRYNLSSTCPSMYPSERGHFVKHSDYETLQAENERLRERTQKEYDLRNLRSAYALSLKRYKRQENELTKLRAVVANHTKGGDYDRGYADGIRSGFEPKDLEGDDEC